MTKLEQLIQDLCPDGVEYKTLANAITIQRGTRVVRKDLSDNGVYPVYQNSLKPLGYHTSFNCEGNTTFIIVAGAAGDIGFCKERFWAADDCFVFLCGNDVLSRFLYHVLLNQQTVIHSKVRKASIPRLGRNIVENIKIPIPPLEVQAEIVRILDKFTELATELTTELTNRKKQYEYYRDDLLSFDIDIPKKKLGDTCLLKAGNSIPSNEIADTMNESTPIPCYGGNGIRGYVKKPNKHGEYPLIGRQGALCGNVQYAKGDFYATEHAVVVSSKKAYIPRFLYHLLVHMNLNQYKSAGAQPGLAVKNLQELFAPVPSIEIQERIVDVLDNFEAICSDLKIGLPAEIEARQKQYEYYRDKLLTFKEFNNE